MGAPDAKAQADAWIVGNEWARLNSTIATPTFTELPAHVGTPNTYQGNSPQFSSAIQLDDRGLPLFFIVDGDVFDGEGFLIAPHHVTTWNEGLVRDNGLLFQGTGEVVVFPVPGRCGKWYVFHSRPPLSAGYSYQELSFAVLDMTVQNELYPGDDMRRGRLYDVEDLYEQGFVPMINPAEGRFSQTTMRRSHIRLGSVFFPMANCTLKRCTMKVRDVVFSLPTMRSTLPDSRYFPIG